MAPPSSALSFTLDLCLRQGRVPRRDSMSPTTLQIIILAMIQGAAELLPVSSSAHVIVAEKLMGLKASSPEMMFLMIMLHAGTMLAVIAYFWKSWKGSFFASKTSTSDSIFRIGVASAVT